MRVKDDLVMILRSLYWAAVIPRRLRRLGMLETIARLDPSAKRRESPSPTERIIRWVDTAADNPLSRRLFRIQCLERCLIQYAVLREYGRRTDVGLGVRRENGGLTGHAWLIAEGRVYSGDLPSKRFTQMITLNEWRGSTDLPFPAQEEKGTNSPPLY